jgi:hypothetical protein
VLLIPVPLPPFFAAENEITQRTESALRDLKIHMYPTRVVVDRYQQTIYPIRASAEAAFQPCSLPFSSVSRRSGRSSSPVPLRAAYPSKSSSAHRPKPPRWSRVAPHSSGVPAYPSSVRWDCTCCVDSNKVYCHNSAHLSRSVCGMRSIVRVCGKFIVVSSAHASLSCS